MSPMRLELERCVLRPWKALDLDSLVRHANDYAVARQLRDAFPHPYGRADGERFLAMVAAQDPVTFFAIEVDGQAAGGIGFTLNKDVERISAELGYWLAQVHWGRGIVSEAVHALTRYAIETHGLVRIYAVPFANNAASCRVLAKAGFVCEGRMRRSAIKAGVVGDQCLYAYVLEATA